MKNSSGKILALLFFGVLMGALDISIVGPAIPEISRTLGVEGEYLSWIFSIYVLFNLLGLPLLARLSDVYGRRIVYSSSVAIFGIGSLVVAMAHNPAILLAGRAIQGFGASGIFPVASAVIGDIFPPEKRGKALGLIGAVFGIAFMIGPILAGVVLKYFEWHSLFLINLPIAAVLIYGSIKLLPGKSNTTLSQFDWKGILLLGLFLISFSLGINDIDVTHFFESLIKMPVFPLLVSSLLFAVLLIWVERKATSPIVKMSLFRRRQVRIVGLLAMGTGFFQAAFVFIPNFAVHSFAVAPHIASFMLIPLVAATAIGSPLAGRLLDSRGSRAVVLTGTIFSGLGMLIMSMVMSQIWMFYCAGILIGFGLSMLVGPSLRYIILNEVGAEDRALSQGLLTMFISMGQISGSTIIGAIASVGGKEHPAYPVAFGFLALLTVVLFFLSFRLKNRNEERESVAFAAK